MFRIVIAFVLSSVVAYASATEPDERWPDFGLEVGATSDRGPAASYFQGFEAPCFGPPYSPAPDDDWIRFFSEVSRVASGTTGIASRNGLFHAHILPPLVGAPGTNDGAFTRLGGYSSAFNGGFVVELDVFLDLNDPEVQSGINADYGFDVSSAVNNQAGGFRRDFIFHLASNTTGQILVGSSNNTTFNPRGNLASGPHFVVTTSGWYTLQWVYRDAGNGTLAVDTNFRSSTGTLLWTQVRNDLTDVIATQIGGNRYLWVLFAETTRLPIDNSRLNSGIREADFNSVPAAGSTINLGTAAIGNPTTGGSVLVQSMGSLQLEVCSCTISGPAAANFSVAGCPAIIAPTASQSFALGCTPSAAGPRNATLSIVTNDTAGGTTFTFPLVCNGVGAEALLIPAQHPYLLGLLISLLAALGLFALHRFR